MHEQMTGAAPGLLIVLGRNIIPGCFSAEDVRHRYDYLSLESRMNAIAAGELWVPGMDILFCGGQTAGPDIPAESVAQKSYLHRLYPRIPEAHLFTDEVSIDTASNAEETATFRRDRFYEYAGIVGTGGHVENAALLFKNYGVTIDGIFRSEEAMQTRSRYHQEYAESWARSGRARRQFQIEAGRRVLLMFDRRGKVPRLVTSRSRS